MMRLDWSDKAAFCLVAVVGLVLAHQLYQAGKDGGAIAILGAASSLLAVLWAQVNATAAREAALLVPPPPAAAPAPRPQPLPIPPPTAPTGGP